MTITKAALIALALGLAPMSLTPAVAQTAPVADAASAAQTTGTFQQRSKQLSGEWRTETRDGRTVVVFTDTFRASGGPDLKVFLSPKTFGAVTGDNATEGSVSLGALKSTRGEQVYALPEGVSLADFKSLLVHCEAFSVLWGGSDL